jgi:hypothetical protein
VTRSEIFHGITSYTATIRDVLPKRQAYSPAASKCQHQSTKPHGDTSHRTDDLIFTSKRIYAPLHANRLPPEKNWTNVPVKHTYASSSTFFTLLRSVKWFTGNGTDSQKMQFLIAKIVWTGVHKSRAPGRHPCLPAGFEPAMLESERPQTHALDGAASGICITSIKYLILRWCLTFEGVQSETCSMSLLQATRIFKRPLQL